MPDMVARDADNASPGASDEVLRRAGDPLLGRRILVAEDDPFITLALEEALSDYGLVVVGAARTVAAAVRLARDADIDIALLDVNLGAERIDAVAEILSARRRPFIFASGCGRAGLPEAYADRRIVEKPFYFDEIIQAIRAELVACPR